MKINEKSAKKGQSLKALSSLLAASIIYATFGLLIRFLDARFPPLEQVFLRFAFAFTIGLIVLSFKYGKIPLPPKKTVMFLIALGVFFALAVLLFTLSVLSGHIAASVSLLYAGSLIFSIFAGKIFFRENLNIYGRTSLILVFAGLFIYSLSDSRGMTLTLLALGLGAGIADGMANLMRKKIHPYISSLPVAVYQLGISALIILPFLLIWGSSLNIGKMGFDSFFLFALYGSALITVNSLANYGFGKLPLPLATIILSGEIFLAALFAFIFFAEAPTLLAGLSYFLIALGIIVSTFKKG